jgi:hypothetical protein
MVALELMRQHSVACVSTRSHVSALGLTTQHSLGALGAPQSPGGRQLHQSTTLHARKVVDAEKPRENIRGTRRFAMRATKQNQMATGGGLKNHRLMVTQQELPFSTPMRTVKLRMGMKLILCIRHR